jgi:putative superfamily III holin-X
MRWLNLLRNLNGSLLGVWRAEIVALLDDLSASGRRLRTALLLLALAGSLLVLLIGTLVFAAIAALSLVLPLWGAALVVAGILALAIAAVAMAGLAKLRSVENPADTVRRRVDDHIEWWNARLGRGRSQAAALDSEPGEDLP